MPTIELTQGLVAMVDDADFARWGVYKFLQADPPDDDEFARSPDAAGRIRRVAVAVLNA
jgi:hypothetical protein